MTNCDLHRQVGVALCRAHRLALQCEEPYHLQAAVLLRVVEYALKYRDEGVLEMLVTEAVCHGAPVVARYCIVHERDDAALLLCLLAIADIINEDRSSPLLTMIEALARWLYAVLALKNHILLRDFTDRVVALAAQGLCNLTKEASHGRR